MPIVLVLGGLVLLAAGGEAVVRGAVQMAQQLGLSKLLIGLVIVAFGTSAPELAVTFQSVRGGEPEIAVGNVIGSNISNLLLVLALPALIKPISSYDKSIIRDASVMLIVSAVFVWLAHLGEISRWGGVGFVTFLGVYLTFSYRAERKRGEAAGTLKPGLDLAGAAKPARELDFTQLSSAAIWLVAGIAALVFGANFLVDGATQIAVLLGVPEAVIGLTVVALGTSLPELATVVMAGRRGEAELAVGGIVGSNIFNILAVMGLTAVFYPIAIDPTFLVMDVWVMMAASLLVIPFLASKWRISRAEGAVLLTFYISFIIYRYVTVSPTPVG